MTKGKVFLICGGIMLLIATGVGGFFVGNASKQSETQRTAQTSEADTSNKPSKNETNKIAVVNLDEGVAIKDSEMTYYADKIISFPNDSFLYTSLEDARTGVKEGKYGAYIIIPVAFSQNIESLNDKPTPADIQYAISPAISEQGQRNILKEVLTFGETLDTDISFMYVSNLLNEFHQAQDGGATVLSNDLKDKEAIDSIQGKSMIDMVEIPELKYEENDVESLDLSQTTANNAELHENVNAAHQKNIEDIKSENEAITAEGNALATNLANVLSSVGKINLTEDANGELVYKDGAAKLGQEISDYNLSVANAKSNTNTEITNLEAKHSELETALQESINKYNQQLDIAVGNTIANNAQLYNEAVPGLTIADLSGGAGLGYEISCEEVVGQGTPPAMQLQITTVPSNEGIANQVCLASIVAYIISNPSDTVDDAIIACGEDGAIQQALADCGYTDVITFLSDWLGGNLVIEGTTSFITVNGDIAELVMYTQNSLNAVTADTMSIQNYDGKVYDEAGNEIIDENGNSMTILTMMDLYQEDIVATKDKVAEHKEIEFQKINDTVKDNYVAPLVAKVEDTKKTFENRYAEETSAIKEYQDRVSQYAPVVDTTTATTSMATMGTNNSEMQQQIVEKGQEYVEKVSRVYATTTENITEMSNAVRLAQEESQNTIESEVSKVREIKGTTSGENQAIMGELIEKLPYTRLGSLEYKQAYEFIAKPLSTTEIEEGQNQPVVAAVQPRIAQPTVDKKTKFLSWTLYALLATLLVVVAAVMIMRNRRLRKQHF